MEGNDGGRTEANYGGRIAAHARKRNGRTEYLLKLTSDRVNGLENALEKNWIAHLILAATGLALVFHIGSFRDLLSNYFIHGGYDQKVIAAVDLALLLYYFHEARAPAYVIRGRPRAAETAVAGLFR
jgi:hypothetical protein